MSRPAPLRPFTAVPTLIRLEDRSVPAAFSPGSIQGQGGWGGGTLPIASEVDQGVDQSGSLAQTGVGSFRVSNSTANGDYDSQSAFAGWPFSPGLSVAAGQPSSGATADLFSATLWFRTVSGSADGSAVEFDLGLSGGGNRNSYIALWNRADADGGLQLVFAEPDGTSGNFFEPVPEVKNISRGAWHRLDITAQFVDGSANDVYTISLDGTAVGNSATGESTFATFEGYYESQSQPYQTTNRLLFRSDLLPSDLGTFSDTAAQGFAIDNVSYQSASSSNPSKPLAYYFTGFEAQPSLVTVNDAFAGLTNGTAVADADPITPGSQPAVVGVDAFANLSDGLAGVASGGQVLAFAGTYTGSSTVAKNTTLVPGGVGGTGLVSTGGVAFAAGSTFAVDLNGATVGSGYDRLASSGAVDVGAANLSVKAGYTPAAGDVFTIITASGGVTGKFSGLPEWAVVPLNGQKYKIHYTSNSVYLALDQADLGVTVTDGKTTTAAGGSTTYTITVTNTGPSAVSGAALGVTLPTGLTGVTFTSVAAGGATGNTNGVGAPADSLTLPSGASVTYTLTGTVSATAGGSTLSLKATITPPSTTAYDPTPGNNSATDTTTVFVPDTTPPTLTFNPAGQFVAGQQGLVTVTFSKPVSGFTAGDLQVTNGTVIGFSGSGTTYSVVLIPPAGGMVQITVPAGAAADAAGNPNVAASAVFVANVPVVTPVPPVVVPTPTPHPVVQLQPRYAAAVGGTVRVYNPTDGSVRELTPFPGFAGSVTIATADLNADGVPELVVGAGAGGGPNVKVFDGATGAEVLSFYAFDPGFTGGVFVAAGGGRIAVGAGAGAAPHVKVFNAGGGELSSFYAYDQGFTGGVRVALSDLNGDGVPEVVTGAGAGGAPHVKVFDGGSLTETASFYAFDAGFTGGVYVAAGGGRIAVGAGAGGSPHVKVFDPAANTLQSFFAYGSGFTGGVRVALTTVDANASIDLLTGAGPGGGPHVRGFGFAMPGLSELASFFAFDPSDSRGVFVA